MLSAFRTSAGLARRGASPAAWAGRALSSSAHDGLLVVEREQRTNGEDAFEVAVVKMNRAPVNSLNLGLVLALTETIRELEADPKVRGMLLASNQKVFSAGLDLGELYKVERGSFDRFWGAFEILWRTLYLSPLSTVAAIEAHAPAGGSILALTCDYRVVASDAGLKMGLNETQLGMIPPRWLQALCDRTVGPRNAEYILQQGEMMSAERALQIGFVDEAVPKTEVVARASAVLDLFCKIPPQARGLTKLQQRAEIAKLAGPTSGEELWAALVSPECSSTLERTLAALKNKKAK